MLLAHWAACLRCTLQKASWSIAMMRPADDLWCQGRLDRCLHSKEQQTVIQITYTYLRSVP